MSLVKNNVFHLITLAFLFLIFIILCIHWIDCFIDFYEAFGILGAILFNIMFFTHALFFWSLYQPLDVNY